ncbi:hypothetical protein BC830DRAFT_1221708 [Chytriomyces sp. MP71]|nr:hypothetical protein BC830DRAFT_1221708 [Chytriomyces sp. MP71]
MVTFIRLLNALDGVATSERCRVFMTTNHISRLNLALIQPGHADVKVKVDNCSDAQTRAIIRRFYPTASDTLVEQFRKGPGCRGPASLQGHFVLNRDNLDAAVKEAKALLVPPRAFGGDE